MEATPQSCPVCDASNPAPSGRVATPFAMLAGAKEFRHPAYSIQRCGTCGVHFKSARLSDAELSEYYAALAYESFESDALLPPDRLIVQAAQKLPAGSRILDYGCGVGRSLAPSAKRHACFGVEPNERAAAVARSRGITILPDADLEPGRAAAFDLIVMSDVYEHLPRPLETVRRLAACLAPGGRLVVVTGLADAVQPPQLLPEFWYFRVPGHLHMVSRAHLEWLAARTGLALEERVELCHYEADFVRDMLQRIKLWAYATTHLAPASFKAGLVRALPVLGRAAGWTNAPMLSCGKDHVFASFKKTESKLQ
jgi:SAM-dependent methyltransferase